jgi:hypothetical protein
MKRSDFEKMKPIGRVSVPTDPEELAAQIMEEAEAVAAGRFITTAQWYEMGQPPLRMFVHYNGFRPVEE